MGNRTRANSNTKRLALMAVLTALALAAGSLESRFPLPFPGMRLGVANIFPLTALLLFGPSEAVTVALMRLGISFFLTGSVISLSCSAGGLILSLPVTIFLYKLFPKSLSVPAISVASAFAFNFGQLSAIALTVHSREVFAYLPLLLICAAFTGYAIGRLAELLDKRLDIYRSQTRTNY
jgi:heptaprenyl diphosphate synthase